MKKREKKTKDGENGWKIKDGKSSRPVGDDKTNTS